MQPVNSPTNADAIQALQAVLHLDRIDFAMCTTTARPRMCASERRVFPTSGVSHLEAIEIVYPTGFVWNRPGGMFGILLTS